MQLVLFCLLLDRLFSEEWMKSRTNRQGYTLLGLRSTPPFSEPKDRYTKSNYLVLVDTFPLSSTIVQIQASALPRRRGV